jgi:RND family efflux transporter MFP subunit
MSIAGQSVANNHEITAPQQKPTAHKPIPPRIKGVVVCLLAILGFVIGWGIQQRNHARVVLADHTDRAAEPIVSVVTPDVGQSHPEIVLPGNTQAFNDTPIYARTNGYLKHWYVDIGAHVKQGQLLAEIDTPEIDQQLEQARADLKNSEANQQLAEITAKRWQNLLKTDAVSKQETDQAVSDLSARRATVDSMTANVHRLEQLQSFENIYAPFTGVITTRNIDIGALIDAGAGGSPKELFHMAAVDRLRVYVSVPEVDASVAQNGAKAILTLDEYPGQKFIGIITRDSDSIDPAMRTLRVEVDINNALGRIKTGAYVLVHFAVPQGVSPQTTKSLTLPANVLLFRSEGLRVAVVRSGHAQLVPVQIGRDYGSSIEIVSGIKFDDQVILNPSDSLTSGTPIHISVPSDGGRAE